MDLEFTVFDDSGLLGLVDAAAYVPFVSESWTYEQLMNHFGVESAKGSILVWDCGDGGDAYRIRLKSGITRTLGFREATGDLVVTTNKIYLASYTALTMAAQFSDYSIPDKRETDFVVHLPPGTYRTRIVQMYDPQSSRAITNGPHFLIEFGPGSGQRWSSVQWSVT